MKDIILAIDPGRDKCGVAAVAESGQVLYRAVVPRENLSSVAEVLVSQHEISLIVVGNGTTSEAAVRTLQNINSFGHKHNIVSINEYRSTDEARKRYWRENPPRGLMRFIPTTMQVPPVPVDDYVAVILAERYFKGGEK